MISFDNTEIAFKSKSNADLNRAYWLFKIIGSPTMVKVGKWSTNTALNVGLPIKGIIKKTIFKQFCGGETIPECKPTIDLLAKYGDRKSTRLNSSHITISYAVFCLKKKKHHHKPKTNKKNKKLKTKDKNQMSMK